MFKKIVCLILCLSFCFLAGCAKPEFDFKLKETKIVEIAYDELDAETAKDSKNYTIMISENGSLVPYLVIASNYHGGTLLLRKEPLDNPMPITDTYGSYYAESNLNQYLNNDFLKSFSADIQSRIKPSLIEITKKDSIGTSNTYNEVIETKVFLLGTSQMGIDLQETVTHEGQIIDYFTIPENRIAHKNGIPVSWWTRTPNTKYKSVMCGLDAAGNLNFGNASDKNYIRPVFCVSPSTIIYKHETGDSYYWVIQGNALQK